MADKSALDAEDKYKSEVEQTIEYVERFDILETINNVGNDEVFTPKKVVDMMLDTLPEEVWHNPDYKWLNPASKTGIFEREIAMRLDEGLKEIIPDVEKRRKHILQDMIFAIGQTKFTSNVARRTVYYCCQANRKCDGIKASDGHYVNGYAIGNGTWFDDEEGNIKTPISEHVINPKTKRCIYCSMSEDSKYLSANQLEKYSYDFIHQDPGANLQKYLSDLFFEGDLDMKFDVIIGNPPYQLSTTSKSAQATPIYQKFVMQAVSLNPRYISMIIQSKWFAGGMPSLDDFRDYMSNCHKIRSLTDYSDSKECFSSNSNAGGVNYFLWDREYNGPCEFTNINGLDISTERRALDEFAKIVRYNHAVPILRKVLDKKEKTLDEITSPLMPFGLPTDVRGVEEPDINHNVALYASTGVSYLKKDSIKKGNDYLDSYNVLIGTLGAEHGLEPDNDGKFRVITSSMRVLKPNEACTHSYFVVGKFSDETRAKSLYNYLKTKFARFLILLSMSSTHLSSKVMIYLPQQDFSKLYTDEELYKKYELTPSEIEYIEKLMKEMP